MPLVRHVYMIFYMIFCRNLHCILFVCYISQCKSSHSFYLMIIYLPIYHRVNLYLVYSLVSVVHRSSSTCKSKAACKFFRKKTKIRHLRACEPSRTMYLENCYTKPRNDASWSIYIGTQILVRMSYLNLWNHIYIYIGLKGRVKGSPRRGPKGHAQGTG